MDYLFTNVGAQLVASAEHNEKGNEIRIYLCEIHEQWELSLTTVPIETAPFNFEVAATGARLFLIADEGRKAALAKLAESNAQVALLTNDVTGLKTEVKTGDAVIRDQARDIDPFPWSRRRRSA